MWRSVGLEGVVGQLQEVLQVGSSELLTGDGLFNCAWDLTMPEPENKFGTAAPLQLMRTQVIYQLSAQLAGFVSEYSTHSSLKISISWGAEYSKNQVFQLLVWRRP